MKRKCIGLYLNSATDFTIRDHKGLVYSVDEAREAWANGKGHVTEWNLAFQRLIDSGFDLDAVKSQYAAMSANQLIETQCPVDRTC